MSEHRQSRELSADAIRSEVAGWWEEVQSRHASMAGQWGVTPGSALYADDQAARGSLPPSQLAYTSLCVATDNLQTAACHLLNFGPTLFSMHSLLRTALAAGAQTVWLLAPDDQRTRLERAQAVSRDTLWNQKLWVEGASELPPDMVDHEALDHLGQQLSNAVGNQRSAEVRLTKVIAAATDYCFDAPSQTTARAEAAAAWRVMSSVVHGLSWELDLRQETVRSVVEGQGVHIRTEASWESLQAALSLAYGFFHVGWRLVDQRATV